MREWLKVLRKEKGFTQEYVASLCHIDRAYYAQIESGKRTPSLQIAEKIADILSFNCSNFYVDYFIEPLQASLSDLPITFTHCDLDLKYTWVFNSQVDFEDNWLIGKQIYDIMDESYSDKLVALKKEVIRTGEIKKEVIAFSLNGEERDYLTYAKPLYNKKNSIVGVATAAMDISKVK
ncbi:helix-turn-helix domain-containing protein [Pontibacillus yanchengensis]|uniref:Helix-turn-helix domain-containing protein n=2 Tax=Pontibacillus yanchengensis TaxID=462910 RepID=A0A6I5A403_9BACI|nr:helix-turn-helix domain-containing protein [Pontibacillus yanchengensis]MYL35091.1 helix-turn-helix domain-containing protein [Pontibacillus yanchengensis]MYL52542.1 helix-turn-helix domain-containing protein [Pontibacillus yanchengensis]